jgi:hypothetical protein
MAEILTFKEYLNETASDWQVLDEAGLSRLVQHIDTRNVGFITAFRGTYSLSENRQRNVALKNDIRAAGFGFLRVVGHWVENEGTPEEVEVIEESFMVIGDASDDHGRLVGFLRNAAHKYQQEAFLFKPYNTHAMTAQYANGGHDSIGQFSLSSIGKMYSSFRKKKFVFRNLSESRGFFARLTHHA